jgi:hypothetical protein
VTATQLQARMADPALTDRQRAEARRDYGRLVAADAGCDGYGERVWNIGGGQS